MAVLLAGVQTASATEIETALHSFVEANVMPWVQDPVLIDAVNAHNAVSAGYDATKVLQVDAQWMAEIGGSDTPLINAVIESAASNFLRMHVGESGGAIYEIFVMDAKGLNVAASGLTSDYWQGDEAKFQKTYGVGADAFNYGEVEFDESSQQYQAQVSFSLTDPTSGELIGAVTVGINPDSVM
ncbi:hypothetical protein P775_26520 [Puniceibacterium antarcticum]|uniref:Uncharacterized protein n=2 Tax=Puniceibacterium antarcticum TaxID=1206336 RepID=A0A2G8QZY3_9RHOB|nr:hypothetical protein P775_26520 [Puniceibacterium antarcticum]